MKNIKAIIFDAYGTLFDVNSAAEKCKDKIGSKWEGFANYWRTTQLEYTWLRSLMNRHKDFWQVTEDSLDKSMKAFDIDTSMKNELLNLYKVLSPFREVPEILKTLNYIHPGSALIGFIGLGLLLLWDIVLTKKSKVFQIIQGPLVAVVMGIVFYLVTKGNSLFSIAETHLVSVPIPKDLTSFIGQFSFPNFSAITNPEVWVVAFTIALVASLETLLCVEATDKLDPHKNVTPTNRELLAQGTGNIISGLIGGLPITQVIVRSSANIQSGGKSKMSAIFHGFLLLISVMLIPNLLNKIPLSVLAAILLIVGYKLAKPALFIKMYKLGWKQFLPFTITVLGIVFIDLLYGIGLGLGVGIVVILIKSYQNSHFLHKECEDCDEVKIKMTLAEEVTFFNKGSILNELNNIEENAQLELDVRKTRYIDNDIVEILDDFAIKAKERNINIKLVAEHEEIENPTSYIEFFKLSM